MSELNNHSEFPPSSMELFYRCPGAWWLSRGLPEQDSSDANEGKMLHAMIAKLLTESNVSIDSLSSEQQDILKFCWEYAEQQLIGCKRYVEQKLHIKSPDGSVLTWGTADAVGVNGKHAYILGWKFGRREVEDAENNLQKASYALAAMQEFNVDSVTTIVIQPRLRHISPYEYTNKEMLFKTIEAIIARCKDNKSMTCNIGPHCNYCKAKVCCYAFKRAQESIQDVAMSLFPKDIDAIELYKFNKLIENLTKKNIEYIKPEIVKLCKSHNGTHMGVALSKRIDREVNNIQAAFKSLSDWIDKDAFLNCCKLSITSLEDNIRKAHKMTEKQTKELIEASLATNLVKTETQFLKIKDEA